MAVRCPNHAVSVLWIMTKEQSAMGWITPLPAFPHILWAQAYPTPKSARPFHSTPRAETLPYPSPSFFGRVTAMHVWTLRFGQWIALAAVFSSAVGNLCEDSPGEATMLQVIKPVAKSAFKCTNEVLLKYKLRGEVFSTALRTICENYTTCFGSSGGKKPTRESRDASTGCLIDTLKDLPVDEYMTGEYDKNQVLQHLVTAKIPEAWREATTVPLLKPGKPQDQLSSYRPISLTSCLGKVMERMVLRRLVYHLEATGALPDCFSGFRHHRGTADAIGDITSSLEEAKAASRW
ncbi:hypothetical protein ISCGN_028472 [Ixodes scapularis]